MKQFKLIFVLAILSVGMKAQLRTYDYFRELKPVNENAYYKIKIGSNILDREGYYRVYEIDPKDTIEVPYVTEQYDWTFRDQKFYKELKIIDKTYETGKF